MTFREHGIDPARVVTARADVGDGLETCLGGRGSRAALGEERAEILEKLCTVDGGAIRRWRVGGLRRIVVVDVETRPAPTTLLNATDTTPSSYWAVDSGTGSDLTGAAVSSSSGGVASAEPSSQAVHLSGSRLEGGAAGAGIVATVVDVGTGDPSFMSDSMDAISASSAAISAVHAASWVDMSR